MAPDIRGRRLLAPPPLKQNHTTQQSTAPHQSEVCFPKWPHYITLARLCHVELWIQATMLWIQATLQATMFHQRGRNRRSREEATIRLHNTQQIKMLKTRQKKNSKTRISLNASATAALAARFIQIQPQKDILSKKCFFSWVPSRRTHHHHHHQGGAPIMAGAQDNEWAVRVLLGNLFGMVHVTRVHVTRVHCRVWFML